MNSLQSANSFSDSTTVIRFQREQHELKSRTRSDDDPILPPVVRLLVVPVVLLGTAALAAAYCGVVAYDRFHRFLKPRKRVVEEFLNGGHDRIGRTVCLKCGKVVYTGIAWSEFEIVGPIGLTCCGESMYPVMEEEFIFYDKDGQATL